MIDRFTFRIVRVKILREIDHKVKGNIFNNNKKIIMIPWRLKREKRKLTSDHVHFVYFKV